VSEFLRAFLVSYWFLLFFAAMWFGIGALVSAAAGWPKLARRFRATEPATGETFRFVSGLVGASAWFPVGYRNCLSLTVNDSGFRLAVLFLFRFLTPPLFIPWTEVESIRDGRFWFMRYTVVRIRGSTTRIMIPGAAGKRIAGTFTRFSNAVSSA
jgi:hypothetical protein